MAIDKVSGVRPVTVAELLAEPLRIPAYQRPYQWTPRLALGLFDDIRRAQSPPTDGPYVLGSVILHRHGDQLDVVDGQQRLLTLTMLIDLLNGDRRPPGSSSQATPASNDAAVVHVWRRLDSRVRDLSADARGKLAAFTRTRCVMLRIETDDADEAFRVFDSQNYRGKELLPHDLLKAYHLREMADESPYITAAVVERWEAVPDKQLDRLFSTYLWRIHRWSRGLNAPQFQARHIDAFKGVTTRDQTPSSRYHLAAHAALPLIASNNPDTSNGFHAFGHAQFQLDAPVRAGQEFFDMVDFMNAELRNLRCESFPEDGRHRFVSNDEELNEISSKVKFRYVTELYLAAMLYYTNRFGVEEREFASRQLFAWAYSLRERLLRVSMSSVDKLARGDDDRGHRSIFVQFRNALSPAVINDVDTHLEKNPPNGAASDMLSVREFLESWEQDD